jgi:hypothetical protein
MCYINVRKREENTKMTEFEIIKNAFARDYGNEMEVWGSDQGEAGITLTEQKITIYFLKGKVDYIANERYEDY